MTVNEKLRNTTIQHAHFVEQYKNHEIKKILALLNKSDKSLQQQLLKYKGKTDTITSKRLKLMRQDIKDIVAESKGVLENKIDELAVNFGTLESRWIGDIIKDAVPGEVPVSFIQPAPTQILAAVKATPFNNETLQGMIKGWTDSKTSLFTNAVQQAFVQGQTVSDVVKTLFGTKALNYSDGLINGTRRHIQTQVRTALNHFSSTSREITYKQNSDLIKGVQWVSTLDGRTTLECVNLDGKVDYEDGTVRELNGRRPPAHYNCRSTTVPVIKSLKEMGLSDKEFSSSTRASMNGQVPETMRYKDWFATQPEAFKKQVLGNKKYELYKDGKYSFDSFADSGTGLSLGQLSKMNAETTKNIMRDYNSILAQSIGKDNYDIVHDIIDKTENKNALRIWGKFEENIKVGDIDSIRGGYYRPGPDKIYFNLKEVKSGSQYKTPWETLFHEVGHAIDFNTPGKDGVSIFQRFDYYSRTYKDGKLPNTLILETKDLLKNAEDTIKYHIANMAKDTESVAWLANNGIIDIEDWKRLAMKGESYDIKFKQKHLKEYINRQLWDIDSKEMPNIADMMEGATKGKVGFGHGIDYWSKNESNLGTEIFAEMYSATILSKTESIRKFFPKTYKVFEEFLEDILNE